jgi:hypothetical protein
MVYVIYGFRLRCVADVKMGLPLVVGIAVEKGGKG